MSRLGVALRLEPPFVLHLIHREEEASLSFGMRMQVVDFYFAGFDCRTAARQGSFDRHGLGGRVAFIVSLEGDQKAAAARDNRLQIGRASCRERVCQYV